MLFFLASSAPTRPVALDLVIILAAAAGMVMVLRHLRIAAIPAYLLTGALIGPHMAGLITSEDNVKSISELATILLMFIVGLHLDARGLGGGMVRIGAICVAATVGGALAMWPLLGTGPLGWPAGLAVSMAMCMTSTAVLLRIMQERRELHKLHGRLAFGSLVVQDMLALLALALLPVLAMWAGAKKPAEEAATGGHGFTLLPSDWPSWAMFFTAVGGVALLIVVCKVLLPRLLREAAKHTSQEVPLVLSAAVALGAAIITAGLGLSPELGAFLAGFVLAGTPFKHQLSGQLIPLRDLFMAVFFTAVGLKLNPSVVVDGWMIIAVATLAVVVLKVVVFALCAWLLGATAPTALWYGFAMFSAGEFAIVILSVTRDLGLIDSAMLSRLVVVVVLSLVLTPTFYTIGHQLRPMVAWIPAAGWSKSSTLRENPAQAINPNAPVPKPAQGEAVGESGDAPAAPRPRKHVVIAGFGIVGRSVADRLEIQRVPFIIVDLNQATIETQRSLGRNAVYGDISNPTVLESVDVEHAEAVVLTIPDDEATLRACRTIRALSPHLFIAARTSFLSKAIAAMQHGADHVTVEEVATAETMARQVIEQLDKRSARA